jgi:hypothetical protein
MNISKVLFIALSGVWFTWVSGCTTPALQPGPEPSGSESALTQGLGAGKDAGGAPLCYSPTQRVDAARGRSAKGCACSTKDADVCIDGVTMVCINGRWESAVDGACNRVDPCAGVEDTVDACLKGYHSCAKRPDGKFCGRVST